MAGLDWHCDCGAVQIRVEPAKGTRCVCYCKDCQAFQRHLGRAEVLDGQGGTDLFQTMPDRVRILSGGEHLACLKLTEKGPLRWYAACCNTAICNTGGTRAIPLASMMVGRFANPEGAGPILARVNRKGATGHIEGDMGSTGTLVRRFLGAAFLALITGRYRKTPFFQHSGAPVAPPHTLDEKERRAAYGG